MIFTTHSLAQEDLGCHVAGGAALRRESTLRHELLRKPEVCHLDKGIVLLVHKQQVLRLERMMAIVTISVQPEPEYISSSCCSVLTSKAQSYSYDHQLEA